MSLAFTTTGPVHAAAAALWRDPLDRREWVTRAVPHRAALALIAEHHYAHGGPNTSVAAVGLYHRGGSELIGAALWLPPIITAARKVAAADPHSVLALSRLAIIPDAPKNAASYLIAGCLPLLPGRYSVLLTFADEAFGHVGGIYQATNWEYGGVTAPRPVWRLDGQMVSPKRGPKTLTHGELRDMGAELIGRSRKHRYVLHRSTKMRQHPVYPKRQPRIVAPEGQP